MPPFAERNRKRFSDIRLLSSNLPNLKLNHELPFKLSNRTNALSKWNDAVGSEEGSTRKEILLKSVPAVHRSSPERSKPCVVTVEGAVVPGSFGVASTPWLVL